jgi:cobalt/nickel transport system permease protein
MHMADALISPGVGGTFWAVSGGLLAWSARRVNRAARDNLVPLMGVLGAFVFAVQMLNFSIPGTGASGHLGGGLLLSVLLGPHAAFLVLASVLAVQALFFADGGLLALGCNIFNLGFFPAFIAYPLLYRPLAGRRADTTRGWLVAGFAGVVGMQLGALGVVLQTTASGISALPFATFLLLMLPIHLAIGLAEGLATAAVVAFVARARPEALPDGPGAARPATPVRSLLGALGLAAALCGGVVAWFASSRPDGLEWALERAAPTVIEAPAAGLHPRLARLQERLALLPDYGFGAGSAGAAEAPETWPAVSTETTLAGLTGGLLTLALAGLAGLLLRARSISCRKGGA